MKPINSHKSNLKYIPLLNDMAIIPNKKIIQICVKKENLILLKYDNINMK